MSVLKGGLFVAGLLFLMGFVADESKKGIKIALTFDDGPSHFETPVLLKILKKKKVKATFFLLGEHIEKYPEVAKSIVKAGHQVGNHGYNHPNFDSLSKDLMHYQITKTDSLIRSVGYKGEIVFRAPYEQVPPTLQSYLDQNGRTYAASTLNGRDWEVPPVTTIVKRIEKDVVPGSVIVLHDSAPKTDKVRERINSVEAARMLITNLKVKGYRFVRMDQL